MAGRDLVPSVNRNTPLITKKTVAPSKTPVLGAVQNPVLGHEHDLQSIHEPEDHGALKPVSPDDASLDKQIQATHAPDMENIDVSPILAIVEEIIRLGWPSARGEDALALARPATAHSHPADHVPAHLESSHDKMTHDKVSHGTYQEVVKMLARPINKISTKIICKCASGGESYQVTMDLLESLSNFTWDAKVVIALAGFAINYGEFRLVEHHHTTNSLAKNIAILKDLPKIMEHSHELKEQFDLLNAILKVTRCIIGFKSLPPMYISPQSPEFTAETELIPAAVYWCITGLLICASTLLNLNSEGGHVFITSTSVSSGVKDLTGKLSGILTQLQDKMRICEESVRKEFKQLLEKTHKDNMEVLNAIFRPREDETPIYHGLRNTNVRLDVLRQKHVLLLISDLDSPLEELHHLIHNKHAMSHEYEILWLPIADPYNVVHHNTFINLRNKMPWFSADRLSAIEFVAIRYLRKALRFSHRPMLLVLDLQGKLSHHNVLPMMWIWGAKAFPFTREWERKLWEETKWNIELIADCIDQLIPDWINTNKVICLYGGDDVDWVKTFTQSTKTAAHELNVQLEMLYVGKRNPKEKVRLCREAIAEEKLSRIFATDDYDFVRYFWMRLESMWNFQKQIESTVDDHIMQGILELLMYDSSEKGWAVFSRGTKNTTMASGDKLVTVLNNYTTWKYEVDHPDKFVPVLDKKLKGDQPKHHCQCLILPEQAGYIPERVVCIECGKTMDKYIMYRCCTD